MSLTNVLIAVTGLVVIAFFCGVFETWIVKNCTSCGKAGKLKALCHLYEGILSNLTPNIFGYGIKRLGVMHTSILCERCMEEVFYKIHPWLRK